MLRFTILLVLATLCRAGHIPYSSQSVTIYPTEWKSAEEWKVPETKIEPPAHVEWKEVETPAPAHIEWKEVETPANYDFKYEVHDEKTGDYKSHSEEAKDGVIKGNYWLIDSDGFKRIVDYTSDDHHGFQATVKREPTDYKIPIPEKKWTESW